MLLTTWNSMRSVLGLKVYPRRRVVKPRGNWGIETERMENRALLSATGVEAPVAAEVVNVGAKVSFDYPNIAGQWHVTGDGIDGNFTVTQTNNKVQADVTMMGISVHLKDKFTKKSPNELFGSTKVTNPLGGGKLKVGIHLNFTTDTSFTGQVHVPALGLEINISGTKTSTAAAMTLHGAKAAPMYPDVSGLWDGSAEAPGMGVLQGTLDVQQNKGKIHAEADLGDGIAVSLKGKINKNDFSLVTGKARITTPVPGFTKVKAPFEVHMNDNYTEFSGVAHSKMGDVTLHAVKQA